MKKKIFKLLGTRNINIAIVLILILYTSHTILAQETYELNVELKLKILEGDSKNSMITISKKGAPFKVIDPSKESSNIFLPLGSEYLFTFTKIGYITKSVIVDTHVPVGREKFDFAKKTSDVELEKQPDDQIILYPHAVARLTYSMQKEDFSFDRDYASQSDKMQKKEKANPKTKSASPTLVQNNSNSTTVKQSENKPEQSIQKPIERNKEVKVIQEDSRKITIITVTISGERFVYRKEEYSFSTFFYKDGKSITPDTFDNETK